MTTALVRHLVRQGAYKSTEIAILTPYASQMQKLRAALSADFEIVLGDRDEDELERNGLSDDEFTMPLRKKQLIDTLRLATVDNFQGEEAKVVIVSLVRSNPKRNVGFLKTPNRINVLLSRAKHGMFLIGNADTYSDVPMWADVQRQLRASDAVGKAFRLRCPRHEDLVIECAEAEDFVRYSPEGGCMFPCGRRLDECGHRCSARCHSQAMHEAFACPQPCPRRRTTCDHQCPKLCGQTCGSCLVLLDNIVLPCGHQKDRVPCGLTRELRNVRCDVIVTKTVPDCNHELAVKCHENVEAESFKCPTKCAAILECGHRCSGSCSTCKKDQGVEHQACRKVCGRPASTCNHVCKLRCHSGSACQPCDQPCEVSAPDRDVAGCHLAADTAERQGSLRALPVLVKVPGSMRSLH